MTDNIQKLYEIAGVNKQAQGYCDFQYGSSCPYDNQNCDTTCPYWVDEEPTYPPFTAEKQLELIKWLGKKEFGLDYFNKVWSCQAVFYWEGYLYDCTDKNFEQALAGLILELYVKKRISKKEIQKIKEILQ